MLVPTAGISRQVCRISQIACVCASGVYTIISTLLKSGHTNGAIDELMVNMMDYINVLSTMDFILKLMDFINWMLQDHPSLLPTLLDIMGPYIQIMGSQIYVWISIEK